MTLHSETKRAVKSLIITLTSMIVVLSVIYLFTSSSASQKGYTFENQESLNEHLKSEQAHIESKIINNQTFAELEDSEMIENMVKTEEKLYITEEDALVK